MVASYRLTKRSLRDCAMLIGFMCLWMSTVGTVHHHDDELILGSHSTTPDQSLRHAPPPGPDDICAACEWEQAFRSAPAISVSAVFEAFRPIQYASVCRPIYHLRPFRYISLRAPPSPLS